MTIATGPDTSLTERRQTPRARVKLASHLRERGRTAGEVCVSDLSETGCKVECPLVPFPGNTVWVRLPGLASLLGTVAWSHGGNAGIGFEQPLHVTTLARFANAGSFMQTAWAAATGADAPADPVLGQDMTRSEQISSRDRGCRPIADADPQDAAREDPCLNHPASREAHRGTSRRNAVE